jgi:outer membrane biosynthesis protein TonB
MTMTDMSVIDELATMADADAAEARPVQGPVSTDEKPKKGRKAPAKKAAKSPKPAKKRAAAPKAKKPAKAKKAAPKKSPKPRAKATKDAAPKTVKTPKPRKAKAPATDKPKRTYTRTGKFIGILIRLPLETLDAIDADCAAKGIATRAEWARQTINKKLGIRS